MITNDGRLHIKRHLAGFTPYIAQSIAYGIGTGAEVVGDSKLNFEVGRADIQLYSYDFETDRLTYKAELPASDSFAINEVALFSSSANAVAGEYGSRIISSFDSATEDWSAGTATFNTTNTRIGADSLRQVAATNSSKTDTLSDIYLDLSGYSGLDVFAFAFMVNGSNNSNVRFRFMVDASNYYEFALGAQSTGYKIIERTHASATVTGAPSWNAINQLQVVTNATAGGSSTIDFDGIRIEDVDTINPDYSMIAREKFATTVLKKEGAIQEIEFSMDVNL